VIERPRALAAFTLGVLLVLNACSTHAAAPASAPDRARPTPHAADVAHGAIVFRENCAACHGAAGIEGGVGPSLHAEHVRKGLRRAVAWIENPDPPMPKLYPGTLDRKDVDDVAAYVETL
jgi:mono/diheme cytochrome c family protein